MQIVRLGSEHLGGAAALFVDGLRRQRVVTPDLPARMGEPALVIEKLAWLLQVGSMLGAFEDGRLLGFLGAIPVADFRKTGRRGAYVPEWGHGATAAHAPALYRALYRAAAEAWMADGCQVHAISILACERAAVDLWFWNSFGLVNVDAVRPVQPLAAAPVASPLAIRKATPADAEALALLDAEHCRHYTASPVFMAPPHPNDAGEFAAFIGRPRNSIWLALDGATPAGFLRCDGYEVDGVGVLESEATVFNNGAYMRPGYRGQRAMPAMLDAALRHYTDTDFTCCAVNFESFNPEAAVFWPRYFEAVCLSLTRVPEVVG